MPLHLQQANSLAGDNKGALAFNYFLTNILTGSHYLSFMVWCFVSPFHEPDMKPPCNPASPSQSSQFPVPVQNQFPCLGNCQYYQGFPLPVGAFMSPFTLSSLRQLKDLPGKNPGKAVGSPIFSQFKGIINFPDFPDCISQPGNSQKVFFRNTWEIPTLFLVMPLKVKSLILQGLESVILSIE